MLYSVSDVAMLLELDPWTVRKLISELGIGSFKAGAKQFVTPGSFIQLCDAILEAQLPPQ